MEEMNIDTNTTEKQNKGNNTAIIALGILVVVILIGCGGYYFYKKTQLSNPIKITTNLISDMANKRRKTLAISDFFAKDKNTQMEINGNIGEYKIKLNSELNLKNEKMGLLARFDGISDDALQFIGNINKEQILFQISENSNIYKVSQDFGELFNQLSDYNKVMNEELLDRILNYLISSIENNFSKEDFNKDKEKISLFSTEITTIKYETTLTKKDIINILNSLIDELSNDEEFISLLYNSVKSMGEEITKSQIKEGLNELKEEFNYMDEINLKYTIYVNKKDVVRVSLIDKNTNMSISFDNYKDKIGVKVNLEGSKFELEYNKKSEDYTISMNGLVFITGNYKAKEKKNDVSLELTYNVPLLTISGKFNVRLAVDSDIHVKDLDSTKALDINDESNFGKLSSDLQNNKTLYELASNFMNLDLFRWGSNWNSVDGIDF